MRKNSRMYKIYMAGVAELDDGALLSVESSHLIMAMAGMIAEATAPKKAVKKPPLLYDEKAVLQSLNYDLAVARHGPLNGCLRRINQLPDDLEKFKVWFAGSMYPWMRSKEVELTYSMLVRKFPEWLERARQYSGGHDTSTPDESWR